MSATQRLLEAIDLPYVILYPLTGVAIIILGYLAYTVAPIIKQKRNRK